MEISKKVTIIGTKFTLQCKTCKSKWGIHLTEDGKYPHNWDVCLKCAGRVAISEKENKNESQRRIHKSR